MKKILILLQLILLLAQKADSQIYHTTNGHVWFFSKAPIEDITAHNYGVACALNTNTGVIAFKVTINRFEFEKDLMKKHFNENYLESEKYPQSSFKGQIENFTPEIFMVDSIIDINVSGQLSLHGINKNIKEKATLRRRQDTIEGVAVFSVRLEDYNIKIPKAVIKNIAEEVDVHIDISLTPYKKD